MTLGFKILAFCAVCTPIGVFAQSELKAPERPSDEVLKAALMEAYHLNGNSMVGMGSIDLSDRVFVVGPDGRVVGVTMVPKAKSDRQR